jgi:hypothetical protein
MRPTKMFSLAMAAAVAALALVGVSPASASELCSTNTSACTGTMYPTGTAISGTSTKAELKTEGGIVNPTVTCTKSTTSGKTTSLGAPGEVVKGVIETLTFEGCTNSIDGKGCTAETGNFLTQTEPWAAIVTANNPSNGNGTLGVTEGTKGKPGGTFKCLTLAAPECSYTTKSASLTVTGDTPAIATANQILLPENVAPSSFGCPPKARWTATYTLSPSPLFVVNP